MITEVLPPYSIADFGAEVRSGLLQARQKTLPSKYLYDEIGSALFEVITALPEYGLFRADERLLQRHAKTLVHALLPERVRVAELGSGTGKKTRWLLEELAKHQQTTYHPIEISARALERCSKELASIWNVSIRAIELPYIDGLLRVAACRASGERLLILFLGSSLGNFDRRGGEYFLEGVRRALALGDALLLGADLEKPLSQLMPAYDDPLGVTACFNLNLLARINRELGANFDLSGFRHFVRYDRTERRIEMHLISLRPQNISIPRVDCEISMQAGETIWTEASYKYAPEELIDMGRQSGFLPLGQWIDPEWPFAETLLVAA
jgi:L-histidine N-alpha-methyltransferase